MALAPRPTSTQPPLAVCTTPSRADAGFTLVELLITTIVVLLTLGITTTAIVATQRNYSAQRERLETANQARAAMDAITRLVRMSGSNPLNIAVTPLRADPDFNNVYDSIRIQSDWNPADGVLDDPYEDITFSVAGGQLVKQEPSDPGPVVFAENVAGMTFTYRDTNEGAIANAVTFASRIAYVTIQLRTQSTAMVQDGPASWLTSSVAVRRTE